jgi:hypothetical protein
VPETTTFYLALCDKCEPYLPVPFAEEPERSKWIEEHTAANPDHHVAVITEVRV